MPVSSDNYNLVVGDKMWFVSASEYAEFMECAHTAFCEGVMRRSKPFSPP